MCRYRMGDVPLNAMRAAIFTRHGINDVPCEPAVVSSICSSCDQNAIEDYVHVFIDCPAYAWHRQSLQPHIDHIRASFAPNGRSHLISVPVPCDIPSRYEYDDLHKRAVTIDDGEQLWVAASVETPAATHRMCDMNDAVAAASDVEVNDPPMPWQWWMRSPIVRELLSNARYENATKLYLARVMIRRNHIIRHLSRRVVIETAIRDHIDHAATASLPSSVASSLSVSSLHAHHHGHDRDIWQRSYRYRHRVAHTALFASPIIGRIRRVSIVMDAS